MINRVERQGKQRRLCPHVLGMCSEAKVYQKHPLHRAHVSSRLSWTLSSTLVHPLPRQKKLAHACLVLPFPPLSLYVAFRATNKSGLETRLWRGDCTVPQKSTKIRTCARKCGVRGADKVRAVRTERNQVCARIVRIPLQFAWQSRAPSPQFHHTHTLTRSESVQYTVRCSDSVVHPSSNAGAFATDFPRTLSRCR